MRALLAAHVEHVLRQTQKGLEGEGALANARFAAHEHDAARDETAAQHAVELAVDHVDAGLIVSRDVTQAHPVVARGVGLSSLAALRAACCPVSDPTRISLKVFHCPQLGHFPNHFALSCPQWEQT